MQAFECHGLWRLPDTEVPPVAGTLRVSAAGDLRLSLIGSLGTPEGLHPAKEHSVILGSVDGLLGNNVTLASCYLIGSLLRSPGDVWEEYRAQRGFFGVHIKRPSDFTFRRAELRVGGLGAWAHSMSGFRRGELGLNPVGEEATLLSYAMPSPLGGPITGGEISLGFELTSSGTPEGYTYSEHPGVVVTIDPPLPDGEINQRFVYPLQNLMTFVSDRAQEVEGVSLWRQDVLNPTGENPEIRLISPQVFPEAEQRGSSPIRPRELLFDLCDLGDGFAPFIERWFRLTTDYADACNIFFGLQYGPPAYLDLTFLGVIEALSLYYTRREDGVAHRDQEERRLGKILGKLPEADADWVRNHIQPRPFPPLQDILHKLLDEHAELMSPLLQTDKRGFIMEVMGTLVYTIHRDPPSEKIVNFGAELYWMIAKLRILLKLCLLRELDFSEASSRSFFAKSGAYHHLCQIASSQRRG